MLFCHILCQPLSSLINSMDYIHRIYSISNKLILSINLNRTENALCFSHFIEEFAYGILLHKRNFIIESMSVPNCTYL